MRTKSLIAPVEVQQIEDTDAPGTVRAIVACYGNVDNANDRIVEGAFDAWLLARQASGKSVPVVFTHAIEDAAAMIGWADPADIESIPGRGLYVKMHLNLGTPTADAMYQMLKHDAMQWSFSYTVQSERKAADGANELLAVSLVECGPCIRGINSETETISVKSGDRRTPGNKALIADVKDGRPVADLGVYLKSDTHDPVGMLARDWILGKVRIQVAGSGKALAYADSLEFNALDSGRLSVSDAIDHARPLAKLALKNLRKAAAVQADQDVDMLAKSMGIEIAKAPEFTPEETQAHEDRLAAVKANARMGYGSWAEVKAIEAAGPQHETVAAKAIDARLLHATHQARMGLGSWADVAKVKAAIAAGH
jgi:HK97 family phage prohead protease